MALKYRQIAYELESELGQMRRDGKMRLPAEDDLCKRYSCSRQTVRSALTLMVDKGLIVKRKGSGSYISDNAGNRSSTIILIVEDEDAYTYPDLISSLKGELKRYGFDLRIFSTEGSYDKERDALTVVMSSSPAAVIIEPIADIIPNHNLTLIEEIHNCDIPVIYLYSSYPRPEGAVCIKEDDEGGIKMLVTYLKDNGHTDIAGLFRLDDSRGLTRYRAFVETLHEEGLPFEQKRAFFYSAKERRDILRGQEDMLLRTAREIEKEASAVICQNDEIAYRLKKILELDGRGDVTIVSFDNSYYARGTSGMTSLGHKSRDLLTTISDTIRYKGFTPDPVSWNIYIRKNR